MYEGVGPLERDEILRNQPKMASFSPANALWEHSLQSTRGMHLTDTAELSVTISRIVTCHLRVGSWFYVHDIPFTIKAQIQFQGLSRIYIFPKGLWGFHSLNLCTISFCPRILHTFHSENPPDGQWPAPMGSWRVFLFYTKMKLT